MTTLLEAAQAVVNASKEYTPTWIHWAIKDRINALEQAIAQEQKPLFKELINKHPGLADELASQTASTNPVVSQKQAGTVDKYEDTRNALTDKRFSI